MQKFFSIFLILFSVFFFGQKKYSTNEIMNNYPFNKASKVKIISYNTDFMSEVPLQLPPTNGLDSLEIKKMIERQKSPIQLKDIIGKENLEGIEKMKTLNYTEFFELSKLLYNTCGKYNTNVRRISNCFFPRNALLFYDENDKVFDFLEVCFQCEGVEFYSEKSIVINNMCPNFYPKIEEYFKNKGFATQYIEEKEETEEE